jgi:hypothetical protein
MQDAFQQPKSAVVLSQRGSQAKIGGVGYHQRECSKRLLIRKTTR